MSNGTWVIGYRPFAKPTPAFTVYQLRQIGPDLKAVYVQDERTGDDALFATKAQARAALRAVTKPALQLA